MRKVEFLDTSLRDGEQTPGVNFSIKEKIAIAKQLENGTFRAIEAGFLQLVRIPHSCSRDCQGLDQDSRDRFGSFCQIRY